MSKISKNIKRLRNEKGFTQDSLAEKISITRQAVSSWENDRTQPDVEMLAKLSEVFGVSIEELIYGKKRNTNLELEKTGYNSTITIVFSILGALLVGVGLVLIFVTFWRDMPLFLKGILSFLPLLLGQASGIFVLCKKKDKVPWCEGGSVLWTAGIAATLTLIYNIFDLSIHWTNVLILIALSVMPVIGLLRSVAPLAAYYISSIYWGFATFREEESLFALVISTVMVIVGTVHSTRLVKLENKSHRSIFAQWISVIAVTVFAMFIGIGIDNDLPLGLMGIMTTAMCLYLISLRDSDMAMPYRIPGLFGTAFMMFIFASIYFDYIIPETHNIAYIALCFIAVIVTAVFNIKKVKDKFTLAYIGIVFVYLVICTISFYAMGDNYDKDIVIAILTALKVPAFAGFIVMIISGAAEKKLIPINLGFVGVAGLVMAVISQSGLSMLGNGLLLLVFGGIILAVNFKITGTKQKTPAIENNEEVQTNEK